MKYAVILILLWACNNDSKSKIKDSDSINGMTVAEYKQHYIDSAVNKVKKDVLFDTAGLSNAPVKVLSAKIVEKEYSNYKDIRLTFKNISDKKVSAIKFRWYGIDAFGEPADMGSYNDGSGSGFTDEALGPKRSTSAVWSIASRNAKKVLAAWPFEVAFSDGTKWELK